MTGGRSRPEGQNELGTITVEPGDAVFECGPADVGIVKV